MNLDNIIRDNGDKSPSAFRTIREVSEELGIPQHVLRFWESKFRQIRPLKRGGGRRYYRPSDINLLIRIQTLLYEDGYTIKGVQKLMREINTKAIRDPLEKVVQEGMPEGADEKSASAPKEIIRELECLRDMLRGNISS